MDFIFEVWKHRQHKCFHHSKITFISSKPPCNIFFILVLLHIDLTQKAVNNVWGYGKYATDYFLVKRIFYIINIMPFKMRKKWTRKISFFSLPRSFPSGNMLVHFCEFFSSSEIYFNIVELNSVIPLLCSFEIADFIILPINVTAELRQRYINGLFMHMYCQIYCIVN